MRLHELTTTPPEVYLDMDGVLADFLYGYNKISNTQHKSQWDLPKAKEDPVLNKIVGTDFFQSLPKFPSADKLVDIVIQKYGHYNICSSPLRNDHENSTKHKTIWLHNNLNPQPKDIIITPRKEKYALQSNGTPNILIDDKVANIERWQAKGGIGILYNAATDSLDKVIQVLNSDLTEHIIKVKGRYRLVSKKTGRNLGTYPTKAGAKKHERQVQYFKHIKEYVNKGVMSVGFSHEQPILDNKFIIKSKTVKLGSDPDFAGISLPKFKILDIQVVDVENPKKVIAEAKFKMHGVLWWKNLQASFIHVRSDYRRLGIATAIYQYVRKLGNTIKPSAVQLPDGADMWQGFQKKHSLSENKPGQAVVDSILRVMPNTQEIWFHGSRATGRHRKNSDTDILVVVPDNLVGDQYLGAVRILQKLNSHFDNYDIQPTKAGTNIHRIAQEEGRLLWSNKQGVAEGKHFDRCFDEACKLYNRAVSKKLEPKLVQVADFQGDGSGADARWIKLPQHVWQHYVVIVGDQVLDPTATQFGDNMPTKYPVSDLDKLWAKQYLIRPRQGVAEGLRVDVPNEDWLQDKIDYARKKSRNSYGVPYMGTTTAYTTENVPVSVNILKRLPGQRGEQTNVRKQDLEAIMKIMQDTGKLPLTDRGEEYAPFITVAWNGEAWVNEGNHRIMAAAALGWDKLPVQISYFDGAERVKSGAMYPDKIGLGNVSMSEDTSQKQNIARTVADFYINDVGPVHPQPLEDYVTQAKDLLKKVEDKSMKVKILDIFKQANKNPYIQGGVITTVGALLAGGVLASAQKFGLSPTQTNMALQAVLNTVIPTMVSRVNGKNWTDTIKYTVASAGIGTGMAAITENFADGKGPGRPGDSQRVGIPKNATMAELEKASHSKGRKGQLARWQLNMRRGRAKSK